MYWFLSAAILVYVSWISSGRYGITGWPMALLACVGVVATLWPLASSALVLSISCGDSGGDREGDAGAAESAANSLELGWSGGLRFMYLASSNTW